MPCPRTGILILNYHQPEATLACVRSVLAAEGADAAVLWIENDAGATLAAATGALAASGLPWTLLDPAAGGLPEAGTVGLIAVPENLGYAGGNNVGLRLLQACGVPFAWVLNNDTLLEAGSSRLLAEAAAARPEIGLWGTAMGSGPGPHPCGGVVQLRDFAARPVDSAAALERDPLGYVSGSSMFLRTATAQAAGWIPEDFFLYYEDLAFTWEVRRLGLGIAAVEGVRVAHLGSLAAGRRSPLVEFYNRRNRWFFIQRYFPERLPGQVARFLLYQVQKRLLSGAFAKLALEWRAWKAFRRGAAGPA